MVNIMAFKTETGKYPNSEEEFTKATGTTLQVDPYSKDGKKWIFRSDGEGLALYSVGPNGEDDNGDAKKDFLFFKL